MGWIKISDLVTGEIMLPKDAVVLLPGQEPPKNYKFAYDTIVEHSFISKESGNVLDSGGADSGHEELNCTREVWIPLTGDE